MSDAIRLHYKKRPSAIIALLKAFWGIRRQYDVKTDYADICAVWKNATIVPEHLRAFNEICGLQEGHSMNIVYPWALVFPLVIRVLGHSKAPLTIFRSVTTKARIIRSQEINGTGEMNVTCRMGSRRLVEKGLEVDVIQSVEISGETAWECLQTFFYRGRFGVPGPNHSMSGIVAIPDAPLIGEWFLPEGLGFRFAKISGDSNGIHFSSRYARMLGFERDFVQPMRVLSKALEFIPSSSTFPSVSSHLESDSSGEGNPMIHQLNKGWNKSNTLEIVFKGPIYYDQRVEVRGIQIDSGFRFDLYAGHNPRPCICGLLI